MSLNPLQFGEGALPGLSGKEVASLHPQNHRGNDDYMPTDKEWAESQAARALRRSRSDASGPVTDRWSGPDPRQRVMGVHDLAENDGQMDVHGFVSERPTAMRGELDPVHPGKVNDSHLNETVDLYRHYGGGHASEPYIQGKWATHPVQQVPSSALIHTIQNSDETETGKGYGRSESAQTFRALFPGRREGRERVNAIRDDVEAGNPIENPAWLIKKNDRLLAVDGHHRIVAAREAGLSHFPARIMDLDKKK